jgi:cell division protein FtsI (penicillin-binding protein 3)
METGRNRLIVASALFALGFMAIGLRLVEISLLKEGVEPRFAATQNSSTLHTERADIVDRNGVLLATSLATASLYANPRRILDADEAARQLVEVLPSLNKDAVLTKLKSKKSFVWLHRHLTPRQQYEVNSLGIPSLHFRREERRVYPHGPLLAHVLGFAGTDRRGLSGIELTFDEQLRNGQEPLKLSIDMRVQHTLREELQAAVTEFDAKGAAGLVIDVNTGETLALVSLPDFDPNHPGQASPSALFNRSTLGVYEMGSTFKVFTTALALDTHTVTLDDGYDATKPIRIARHLIRDFRPQKRWLSVREIFVHSSNIGTAKMALDVGTERQQEFLGRLGLLEPSHLEVPEVGTPVIPYPWRQINTMTIAFGHGLAVSPVQLASAVASIVNGGIIHNATLTKTASGVTRQGRRVISEDTSKKMRRLMRRVVEKGTGHNAAAPGYLVGGKTGTANKAENGGYSRKAKISSFVGVFPMNAPRYLVLALFDEPKGNKRTFGFATGGWVAAPTVGRVISRVAPLLGVAPVEPELQAKNSIQAIDFRPEGAGLAAF